MSKKYNFMNLLSSGLSFLGNSEAVPFETESKYFTITSKTIRFGKGTEIYPLKNIVRFGKYVLPEPMIPAVVIILVFLVGLILLFSGNTGLFIVGMFLILFGAFGVWQRYRPPMLAFGLESSSSCERYIITRDENFVDKVVEKVASIIENEYPDVAYCISIQDATIKEINIDKIENRSVKVGGNVTGDIIT